MMVVFPRQVWVLKRELLWIPVVGLGVRQMHAIAIDRKAGHSAVAQVIEQGKARLEEGDWVMMFPGRHAHARRRDAPLRRERHAARTRGGPAHRAGRAQRGLLLAAAGADEEARHRAGGHRRAGRPATGRDVREINEEIQAWIEATVRSLDPGGMAN